MLTLSPALQLLKILSQKWLQFGWSVKIGMQSSLTACKLHAALSTITSGQFEKCLSVFGRPPPSINVNIFQYFFVVCSRAPGMLQLLTIILKVDSLSPSNYCNILTIDGPSNYCNNIFNFYTEP